MATKSDSSKQQDGPTPAVEREGVTGQRPQSDRGRKGSTDVEEDVGTNVRGDIEHELDEDEDEDEQDVITERNPRLGDIMIDMIDTSADRARGR